jgi:hypothetical protein
LADLIFERGDRSRPAGHAFLYFTQRGSSEVLATYVIVPPIALDFARYVPPLLASSLGSMGAMMQASFMPIPPAPESLALAEVHRLAELRGDDVIQGGVGDGDVTALIGRVATLGQEYADAYQAGLERAPRASSERSAEPALESASELDANALLYSVLTERERVDELARRLGPLRYAAEGRDSRGVESIRREMRAIAAYLPAGFRAEEIIEAAARPDSTGGRLAQLLVDRAYRVSSGDLDALPPLDAQITALNEEA